MLIHSEEWALFVAALNKIFSLNRKFIQKNVFEFKSFFFLSNTVLVDNLHHMLT